MQLVPIIPRQEIGVEDSLEVKGVAAVQPAKPVQQRTRPPLISLAHERTPHTPEEAARQEKRLITQQAERRTICRRVQHFTILQELRSSVDRRRRKQRSTDIQLHIDEEV